MNSKQYVPIFLQECTLYMRCSAHFFIILFCNSYSTVSKSLITTYIQLPKFLTAKVDEMVRSSTIARSILPTPIPIIPIPLLPAIQGDVTEFNPWAQECRKSDTSLPAPVFLTVLTDAPHSQMLHSSPVFALNKVLTAQPSSICCLLAQSACTSSSGCSRTRRNPQGMLKDLKDLTTPVRFLRLPLHYWRPSAAPPPPPPPPGHHGSRSPPWVASAATIQVVLPTTLTTPKCLKRWT